MKTFVLKSLEIIDKNDKNMLKHHIPLLDGLIINREDDDNQWIIEAYIDHRNYNYLKSIQETSKKVMVEVKITNEENDPALFITSIIGLNKIGENMNVLFKGTIIDQSQGMTEELLKNLIDEGYEGEELLSQFKQLLSTDSGT